MDLYIAKIGDNYVAGTSIDTIARDAKMAFVEYKDQPIKALDHEEVPESYMASLDYIKRSNEWRKLGTFFLIKDFDKIPEV